MQRSISTRRGNARLQSKPAMTSVPQLGAIVGLLALFLTAMTALLYALAQAWNTSYLHAYGVEASLFTDVWHFSIYSGSVIAASVAVVIAVGLGGVGLLYLLLAWLFGAFDFIRGSSGPPSWLLSILRKIGVVKPNDAILGLGLVCVALGVFVSLICGAYLKALHVVEEDGLTQAKTEITMIKAGDAKAMESRRLVRLTITRLENNSPITEIGIVINCQVDTFCAIRLPDTTLIFPTKSVVRMQGEQVKG